MASTRFWSADDSCGAGPDVLAIAGLLVAAEAGAVSCAAAGALASTPPQASSAATTAGVTTGRMMGSGWKLGEASVEWMNAYWPGARVAGTAFTQACNALRMNSGCANAARCTSAL